MTPAEGRADIYAYFKAYWDANAGAAVGGTAPGVLWDGIEKGSAPDESGAHARLTLLPAGEYQATLADETGARRWTSFGSVIVECYAPRGKQGFARAEALATVARDAFRGRKSPGGAWFKNASVRRMGPDKGWFRFDAVTQFEFDDVK